MAPHLGTRFDFVKGRTNPFENGDFLVQSLNFSPIRTPHVAVNYRYDRSIN